MFWGHKPTIHFIGIGGSGMSGIAEILLSAGIPVTGSDTHETATILRLRELGANVTIGHRPESVVDATCVVVSTAVAHDNCEVISARLKRIPVIPRAEMLAEVMRLKRGIAIAGSHGKTTTTSMVGQFVASTDPSVVVGGRLQHWNASSVSGKGDLFVIEADESDRSFLKFSPVYTVVTNIDREHMDVYRDLDDLKRTFLEFMNRSAFFGMNWICLDCPILRSMATDIAKPVSTYGFSGDADLQIREAEYSASSSKFRLVFRGQDLGFFQVPIVGRHIVLNATAALGIGLSLGLSLKELRDRARAFVGADRRLQNHFDDGSRAVIEDYGHHPTEIRATLEALVLKYPERQIRVIFQPHRYSRTKFLFHEFAPAFLGLATHIYLLPIYAAHEAPLEGISSEALAKTFQGQSLTLLSAFPDQKLMESWAKERETVTLVLGAGPLTPLALRLAEVFAQHRIFFDDITTSTSH